MLYVGRISKEKGVLELPKIYRAVKQAIPDIAIAVVGEGPEREQLRKELPEGNYLDWMAHEQLPAIYSAADVLVFPSKFDTFSQTALESLSCGLPVISYTTKGTKDIISDGICGYLVTSVEEMCEKIISYLANPQQEQAFRQAAIARAKNYDADSIVKQFVEDIGL